MAEPEAVLQAGREPSPDEELPDWLQELRAEPEGAEPWPPDEEEAELEALAEETVEPLPDEELPDWLQQLRPEDELQPEGVSALAEEMELTLEGEAQEPEIAAPDQLEELEWLRELELTGEEPEEQVERAAPALPAQALEAEQIAEEPEVDRAQVRDTRPLEALPEPVAIATEMEERPAPPQVPDTESRLALARARLSENVLDESAQEYELLVQEPELARQVVGELEDAVQAHPDHHALQRVLGDAYMRTGQLQKALAAYRQALNKLYQGD
jgi:tetratricopeptide (TPR) repeat protein